MQKLSYRKANIDDLKTIIALLIEDNLGQTREELDNELDSSYINAFHQIDSDPSQYLMVVENTTQIVATCHLSIMPSLTFKGSTRMQIEAVRVSEKHRGQKIGQWMINTAIEYGKSKGASIIQLTTNKTRVDAKKFYEQLGFEATHEGMKLYLA
jgi:ribosomal protein S18 acetylase RimI-like enzyme